MIRAVLFDVGGTLHEVHREPELEIAFCSELLSLSRLRTCCLCCIRTPRIISTGPKRAG